MSRAPLTSPQALPTSSVVHVAAGEDFVKCLTQYVADHWPRSTWANAIIFLPNRRSVKQVREAFLDIIGEGAALLPSLIPLADVDAEALLLLQAVRPDAAPRPVLPSVQRRLIMAKQVEIFVRAQGHACNVRYALDMADSLAQLYDESVRYGVEMRNVRYLVDGAFSAYWQKSAEFLDVVFTHWPRIQDDMGCISHAEALISALTRVSESWEQSPPAFPVIVAGSTGSQPATARLLQVVAGLPRGTVLLPSAAGAENDTIPLGHPLYHVASLSRRIVKEDAWKWLGVHPANANADYVSKAFNIDRSSAPQPMAMPDTLVPIDCADEWEEARVISLIIREKISIPHTKVMVVSPDRATLGRVAHALRRWGIVADSSGASDLNQHSFIVWVQSLLAMVQHHGAALESLAFFQHPLTFSGDAAVHSNVLRLVDARYARGFARQRGVAVLARLLAQDASLDAFSVTLTKLEQCHRRRVYLHQWADAIIEVARACGADVAFDSTVETLFASLLHAADGEALDVEEYALLLSHACEVPWFLHDKRPHPHIFLHTPIEARLQSADFVILAGLNEDMWPRLPQSPWLNQSMRSALGLPTHAHELSLQSHDFMMLASHSHVFLTRPGRVSQQLMSPSRWWQRLMLMRSEDGALNGDCALRYISWARDIDKADTYLPEKAPLPNPPVDARPRSLRATHMQDLLFNPYAVYARSVLALEPLDDIDREMDASFLGLLMHDVLEEAGNTFNALNDEDIVALVDDAIASYQMRGKVQIFWRERLLRGVLFFMAEHRARLEEMVSVESEADMHFDLPVMDEVIRFRGRADRIEQRRDGSSAIVDFKTGGADFSQSKMRSGELPQLSLYHMADTQKRYGSGFLDYLGNVSLSYWVMPHGPDAGTIKEATLLKPEEVKATLDRFTRVCSHYLMQQHPMLYAPTGRHIRYDYSALARAAEWGGVENTEDQ